MLARIPAKNANPLYPYVDAEDLLRGMVELFALYPHLPKHLNGLLAGHEASGEGFSVFNHVFVGASNKAVVAEDYLASYRLRTVEELQITSAATDIDSMVFDTHNITSQMVLAGVVELFGYDRDYDSPDETVRLIYRAMECAKVRNFAQSATTAHQPSKSLSPPKQVRLPTPQRR
jgi:hypothetical protein